MEFNEIVVKESPGLCRCCLSEGCYKDLGTEYTWMNETEVYADMLLECFDISITQHNEGPNGPNRLICEVCITRLRDACNFKKQVMDSEKKFIDMMGRGEFRPKMLIYQTQMKCEDPAVEQIENANVEYLEDEIEFGDDDLLKDSDSVEASVSDITVSALPIKGKRGRPRKATPVKPEKRAKVAKIEDKPKTSKAVAKEAPSKSSISSTLRNKLMKRNAISVLESSTVIPFKWQRHNYLCFFCHLSFNDTGLLKGHTIAAHTKSNIKSAVSYLRRDEKVKIDVSSVECRLCNEKFDNLDHLIGHLKEKHSVGFNEEYGYGLIPYFLHNEVYNCAVCKEEFQYFSKLNQHMNEHYGNYICEACGKSFLSQDRLRCHSLTHGQKFRCNICTQTFDSITQRNNHESKVHNKDKLLKCFYCEETFQNYVQRKKHHMVKHDVKAPEFPCPVCGKIFHIQSKMQVHLKEVHIREKNYSCSICEQKFFSKSHVRNHMIKHFGDRVYQCEVCQKSYARQRTLKEHMRIHSSNKKIVCSICSKNFAHNCSLKLHMKMQHTEVVEVKSIKTKKFGTESSSMRRRRNLQIIFNNTSIIPFKWRGKYLCFYCSKDIAEYTELRKHTKEHGECSIKDHSLKVLKGGQNMEIKVDISNISCEVCSEPFPSFDEVVTHLFVKHKLEYDKNVEMAIEEYKLVDLSCIGCEEKFTYFGYLVSHVNTNHPKNCLICDKCNQKFNKKRDLFSHMKNYHREGGYQCELCPQTFSSLNILRKHRNNRHLTRCNICHLKLPSAALKQKHMDLEHPDDGSLQCDNCLKEFHTKQGLRMHNRKCKGEDIFEIAIKKEEYVAMDLDQNYEDQVKRPSVKQIRENIVIILNMSTAIPFNFYKNKFNCFYCSKDFPDSDLMREHTVLEHPVCDIKQKCIRKCRESVACVKIDISSLACKVCFESMTDLDHLIDHLIAKHEANYDKSITTCLQPYRLIKDHMACPNCPSEVFRFFGTLLKHMNNKHTNNNIICVYCGQTFRRDQNLRVHIWRHHRDGRFKCNICGAECNIPSRLYMHMARAHGVKAAKCPKCSETFTTQYLRQKHLIEAHNSGHKCSYCGKLFTRNSFMRDHVRRTHLKEKNVECSICNMKFFNNILLRRHMVKHSGEKNFHCDVCGERFFWRKNSKHTEKKHSDNFLRRRNLVILLNHTTLVPFKWRGKYLCFYCGDDMYSHDSLRKHTKDHGPCNDKDRAIRLVKSSDIEIKIDVSDITCEICNETFPVLEEIINHLIKKHDLPYNKDVEIFISAYRLVNLQCLVCDKSFNYFRKLIIHMNNQHPDNCFPCPRCDQKFNKKRDLGSHMRSYHKESYDCHKCDDKFPSSAALKNHLSNSHSCTCNICFKTFSSESKRLTHLKSEHDMDQNKCGFCDKVLTTKQAFFRHASKCKLNPSEESIVVEDEDNKISVKVIRISLACIFNMTTALPFKYYMNRFRCFYCPKDFTFSDDLKHHTIMEHPVCDINFKAMKLKNKYDGVLIKIDISKLTCKLCLVPLKDLPELIAHLSREHKANCHASVENNMQPFKLIKDDYSCPICEESFRYFGVLLKHVSANHNNNKHICMYCGKSFRTDPNLRGHITRRHNKSEKFDCDSCELLFNSKPALKKHQATVHGTKDIKCIKCSEKFISQYAMQRHLINSHSTGHKCTYCDKLFTKNSFMVNHVRRSHLKEKNVECSVCFEKFFDGARLKMHMVKHVGERNFHCDICGKKFLWKRNLRGHMTSHIRTIASQDGTKAVPLSVDVKT
uniref:SFRICE_008916 n=1 Tax=Spodoptera frugiperda TaxID=7108 RepID=A0A2H1VCI6_SPOFR